MSMVKMTVRQIMDLGLWDKVCDYKGWDHYILKEGRIDSDEFVEFDTEFKKEHVNIECKIYCFGDKLINMPRSTDDAKLIYERLGLKYEIFDDSLFDNSCKLAEINNEFYDKFKNETWLKEKLKCI